MNWASLNSIANFDDGIYVSEVAIFFMEVQRRSYYANLLWFFPLILFYYYFFSFLYSSTFSSDVSNGICTVTSFVISLLCQSF